MGICSETRQLKDTVLHLDGGSVTDLTNYGNDGTFNGTDIATASNATDGFVFNGTDDYIDTPDNSTPPVGGGPLSFLSTDEFAISIWYKGTDTDTNSSWGKALLGRDNGDVYCQLALRSGYFEYIHYDAGAGGWQHNLVSATLVADGNWHHLVYVNHPDETGDIYVDGVAEVAGGSSVLSNSRHFVGSTIMRGVLSKYTSGSIKDVRVISRAITVTEIRELYNATARPDITGTVLHLKPETGLVDQSGTQDPATYNGNAGVVGRRFEFNGTGDYITVPDDASLTDGDTLSISAWAKVDSFGGSLWQPLVCKGTTDADEEYCLLIKATQIYFDVSNVSGPFTTVNHTFATDTWYHIVAVHERVGGSSTLSLYVNGVDITGTTIGPTVAAKTSNGHPVAIGSARNGLYVMDGSLDDIRIFSSALTAAQVLSLYEGVPGYEPPLPVRAIPDTVLHLEAASGERDLSNHANYGTFTGTDIAANSTDTEFVFNGTDDYVNCGDVAEADFGTGNFTVSFWVNFTAASNQGGFVFKDAYAGSDNGLYIYHSTGGAGPTKLAYWNGSSTTLSTGTIDGAWRHVAVVREGTGSGEVKFYIDGVLDATTATDARTLSNTKNLTINGSHDANAGALMDSQMDDIRIISRALSAGEVALLYNKGVANYRPVGLLGGEVLALHPSRHDVGVLPGTVLQLDGKTGVTDQSPEGNDGTLVGDTFVNSDGYFDLDGTGDKINLGRPLNAAEGTMSLRFRTTDSLTSYKRIITDEGGGIAIRSNGSTGKLMGYISDGTPKTTATSSSVVDDGEWHEATFTWDSTNAVFYLDGTLVGSVAAGAIANVTSYDLSIGYDGGSGYVDMEVDSFRLLDRALSATEVTTLYNNDITDESGNGNDGTLTGGAYVGESDEIVFDGVDDYVACGNIPQTGEVTLSAWVNADTVAAGTLSIISHDDQGTHEDYMLEINRTAKRVSTLWGGSVILTSNTDLVAGQWYHLVVVRSGSAGAWTATIYVDGVADGTTSTATNPNGSVLSTTMIGKLGNTGVFHFSGSIRDPRIFDRALTAAEVAFLASEYEVETPNTKGSVLGITPSFDDWGNSTLNAIDLSGNGNVGTLTNMDTGDWVADTDEGGTRALDFDGAGGDRVTVTAPASVIAVTADFTMSSWFYTRATSDYTTVLQQYGGTGTHWYAGVSGNPQNLKQRFWIGGSNVNSNTYLSLNTWHHIAVSREGSTITFFLDGVADGGGTISTTLAPTGDLTLSELNNTHDGYIDDTYIFPRALNLDEIKALASTRNYFDCPIIVANLFGDAVKMLMGQTH